MEKIEYKFVEDINQYVEQNKSSLVMDEFWAKKIGLVKAVKGNVGDIVKTYTKDGHLEVENIVKGNIDTGEIDYVVTNSFGETYVVDYYTFNLKYKRTNKKNVYAPKTNPIRVVRAFENIMFKTKFNKIFKVKCDDYLIIPYNRHIYGITKESLYENYTFIKD